MARAWQRFAAALFCVVVVAALGSCKRPTPGGACTSNGKIQCSDATSALLCQNNVTVAVPCRGPHGCQGQGPSSTCDDDLAMEGDACQQPLNENYSCSTDHAKELVCKDGKFQLAATCRGPKKCSVTGSTISCDDSVADVGDPCLVEAGDKNFGCSTDKKNEVQCDAATSKFVASNGCRGPKGCWIEGDLVHCDTSLARENDPCHPVDNRACSEDGRSDLKCTAQMKWTKQRDCKRDGCKVKGHEIWCE